MDNLEERVKNDFMFHPVTGNQGEIYGENRRRFLELALHIVKTAPRGREQSLALTALEEAMFWANAATARSVGA